MHAVAFQMDVKPDWTGDVEAELDMIVAQVKQAPGFRRGTWASDGARAMSLLLFDSEEVARGVAANVAVPPEASVTLRSVDVYEVARDVLV